MTAAEPIYDVTGWQAVIGALEEDGYEVVLDGPDGGEYRFTIRKEGRFARFCLRPMLTSAGRCREGASR